MQIGLTTLLAALLALTASGSPMMREEAEASCTLSGTYTTTNLAGCTTQITIGTLSVPSKTTLDLTTAPKGAKIVVDGVVTFATSLGWAGPLVDLTDVNGVTISGTGTFDGNGAAYWSQSQSATRPLFFKAWNMVSSTLSGFTVKNSPYRTFSVHGCTSTTLTGLTLNSQAGDGVAKNTDGFDLGQNDHVSITGCHIYNQDDCLAMQSSTNTIFSGNTCSGGHGISIGSLGGSAVDKTDTVNGLTVYNNKIIDSVNGIRIKTIMDMQGLVTNANYTSNTLTNVENAIVIHSDYEKSGDAGDGYSGKATSKVEITDITISGLTGTATNVYDIVANPSVVSNWKFSGINVSGKTGSCSGQPSTVKCA